MLECCYTPVRMKPRVFARSFREGVRTHPASESICDPFPEAPKLRFSI